MRHHQRWAEHDRWGRRGTLDGRVGCDEMLWLDLEGRVRPHDRLLLHIKPKCRIQGNLSGQDYLCVSSWWLLRLARKNINADILRRVILKDWGPCQALRRECTATPWRRRGWGEADAHRRKGLFVLEEDVQVQSFTELGITVGGE